MISRRHLIRSMGALLAAPAIVRAGSLMPVRALADDLLAGIEADKESVALFLYEYRHAQLSLAFSITRQNMADNLAAMGEVHLFDDSPVEFQPIA